MFPLVLQDSPLTQQAELAMVVCLTAKLAVIKELCALNAYKDTF